MQLMIAPPANRGANSQNVHLDTNSTESRFQVGIDWIQATGEFKTDDEFIDFVDFIEKSCYEKFVWSVGVPYSRGMTWDNHMRGAEGSLIAWTAPKDSRKGFFWVSLGGRVVSRIGDTLRRCKFIKILVNDYGLKFTRIDIAIDDFEKELKFKTIWEALDAGNFSGFREWKPIPPGSKPGWTIYLGTQNADRFVRIYDKFAESKGEIDAIRWETVFKSLYAVELANQICQLDFSKPGGWIGLELARFALGGINFIEKSDKNLSRCKILDWYESFISAFNSPVKLVVQRIKPTIDRTIKWLERTVAASLQMICQVKNSKYIDKLLEIGESRLGSRHYALISTSKLIFEST